MRNCTYTETHSWRDFIKEHLAYRSVSCLDPTKRKVNIAQDKADIRGCDVMLAYCWKPSVGTAMEIMYAYCHDKHIIVVGDKKKLSSWITHHAQVFSSLKKAIRCLHEQI